MCEVHKRIDLLRAAETLQLDQQDDLTRQSFLARLEEHRWSGPELNEFEAGLALEIDLFLHGIGAYVPASFS
ncbi:hypothetical protein SAMN05421757_101832 [Tropicimonas sediminicola]|uniref:Uncharacterized protein n=2 Tax=Tropicimonas sediminicola TaxID=1031541 RepID=A0A239DH55_9RHOB|nr:hypothetical protein SAMN05421757_101832 [Tropicimonas sediminicola]